MQPTWTSNRDGIRVQSPAKFWSSRTPSCETQKLYKSQVPLWSPVASVEWVVFPWHCLSHRLKDWYAGKVSHLRLMWVSVKGRKLSWIGVREQLLPSVFSFGGSCRWDYEGDSLLMKMKQTLWHRNEGARGVVMRSFWLMQALAWRAETELLLAVEGIIPSCCSFSSTPSRIQSFSHAPIHVYTPLEELAPLFENIGDKQLNLGSLMMWVLSRRTTSGILLQEKCSPYR